jgi:hypothetical protein
VTDGDERWSLEQRKLHFARFTSREIQRHAASIKG